MARLTVRTTISILVAGVAAISAVTAAGGQSSQAGKPPNKLVTAKLICVKPMEDGLDQWILEDLRAWGRYKVTGDPEGADLVMSAYKPEKLPHYVIRQGVPEAKKERAEPPAVSITVADWALNEALWQADILNKKPKKDDAASSPGPQVDIYARGLKPAELAQKLTRNLRNYVEALEKSAGGAKQ